MSRAASLKAELTHVLKDLRLPTVRACYAQTADQARQEELAYEGSTCWKWSGAKARPGATIASAAIYGSPNCPWKKNLQTLERARLPNKLNAQLTALLDGTFLDRSENVLAFGNPGSGKTHVLCALGQELIHQDRQILFM